MIYKSLVSAICRSVPAFNPLRASRISSTSHRQFLNHVSISGNVFLKFQARSMFIQTESTPNENSVKFIPGKPVMGDKGSLEFITSREAMASPLAKKLFLIDGVESVFFGPDFVAVNKTDTVSWPQLKPDVFATLMDFFSSGQEILVDGHSQASDTRIEPGDSETVQMIKELLETRIRPSIQEDGGDIEYLGFDNGIVKLKLRGACRTCDSSSVTLKHGIQNMLMHYIPEVLGVEQIQDELEQLSNSVFEKVDSKLKPEQ